MPLIIEEVTTEALKPTEAPRLGQPQTELPGDTAPDTRSVLAELRRIEARRARLRAD